MKYIITFITIFSIFTYNANAQLLDTTTLTVNDLQQIESMLLKYLTQINNRIDKLESKLDVIDTRLHNIQIDVASLKSGIEHEKKQQQIDEARSFNWIYIGISFIAAIPGIIALVINRKN